MSEKIHNGEHVGEMLSGFIDGELTQQDRQRVQVHIEDCGQCHADLEKFAAMRRAIGKARLSDLAQDKWRETMDDTTVKASRGIGWLLVVGGALIALGLAVIEFVTSSSTMTLAEKLIVGGVYGGMLLIFISVLRQRLIERKTDKYKDVEI